MATEIKPNPVAKFGPIGAPILGGVLLIGFVCAVQFSGSMSEEQTKLEKASKDVNSRLAAPTPGLPPSTLPDVSAVLDMVSADERKPYAPIAGETKLANLPVVVKVNVELTPLSEFETFDENKDGFWDEREFRASPYYGLPGKVGQFKEWDRHKDAAGKVDQKISRAEYDDPPVEDDERFKQLDKNGVDGLTAPDEISNEDALKWDRPPYDGKISLEEFKGRFAADESVDLGAVKSVGVTVDLEKMEIVVTWETPELGTVPPDITYLIERFSPETVEARKKEYGKRVAKYTADLQKWEADFDKWWNGPTADDADDPARTEKNVEPDRRKALPKFEQITPKPVMPEEPQAWEAYAEATGNEFRDVGFETDATYTYAVRAMTGKPLKRGVAHDIKYGSKTASARVVQPTHPVRVPNRVVMSWNGTSSGTSVNITLTKWLRYGIGQESVWYKVSINEAVDSATSATVGGEYSANQIAKDRQGKAFKAGETTPADIATILPSGAKMDFRTGYRFVANTGQGSILNHAELGDYELPKATRSPAAVQAAPAVDSTLEIRVVSVASLSRNTVATFEITRWHQVGDKWYRVVLTRSKVKTGEEAGASINLDSPGEGVKVYDTAGEELKSSALTAIKGGMVDMLAGKFDGLDERSVKLGSDKLDLFGTLYR